jgi:hypothetical protein
VGIWTDSKCCLLSTPSCTGSSSLDYYQQPVGSCQDQARGEQIIRETGQEQQKYNGQQYNIYAIYILERALLLAGLLDEHLKVLIQTLNAASHLHVNVPLSVPTTTLLCCLLRHSMMVLCQQVSQAEMRMLLLDIIIIIIMKSSISRDNNYCHYVIL